MTLKKENAAPDVVVGAATGQHLCNSEISIPNAAPAGNEKIAVPEAHQGSNSVTPNPDLIESGAAEDIEKNLEKSSLQEVSMDGIEVVPVKESERRKVLVAGAGPGGLYAAYTAARRGHEVILCEKESEVGGILKSEQALPFKHEMYELSGTYRLLAEKAGVEIRLNTEVTPEYVEKENPYALIIAAGSTPLVPPIPGLRGDNVVVVNNYYKEKDKVTDDVVVFGGGLAGCECAIHLGMEGKRVHLVEMRDQLAPDANVRHRPLLLKEIDKYVTVHTGYKGLEVTAEGIWCENAEGERVLVPGTSVICALGQRSRTDVVEALMDTAPYVRVIGDASRVSTITNAVYWGHYAALDI